jgi:hypothetical protein
MMRNIRHFLVLAALFLGSIEAATTPHAVSPFIHPDTSTVAPAPIPTTVIDTNFPNNVGTWKVSDKSTTLSTTCILFKAAIQLTLIYSTTTKENKTVLISVPANARSAGSCTDKNQTLILKWNSETNPPNGAYLSLENSLNFTFFRPDSHKPEYIWIVSVNGTIHKDSKKFPNANDSKIPIKFERQFKDSQFRTNQDHSYRCNAKVAPAPEIEFAKMQFEAFRSTSNAKFTDSNEVVCAADSSSLGGWKIFGIIVLVLLVAILLGGGGYYSYKKLKEANYLNV